MCCNQIQFNKLRSELNSQEFSYPVYFGGEDESMFPNHAAYWVGFNLVSQFINMHGGCAASLAQIPSEQIVGK